MPKFSDRLGITQPPTEIQINTMNSDLRNSLWNWLSESYSLFQREFVKRLYIDYFKTPADTLHGETDLTAMRKLREYFMRAEWYEIYNLTEHILQNRRMPQYSHRKSTDIEPNLNQVLTRELSGYRAINGEIVPITDQSEVEAIRQAVDATAASGLGGPSQHILNALHLLGKKPEPDYRNSIKESISAVEGICKLLTGEKSGGIKVALEKLSSKAHLHESLKKSLLSLYGYTSDEAGIRHAILESKDIGFAEAKFMLVTCSAFVNFLIDKARQAGML